MKRTKKVLAYQIRTFGYKNNYTCILYKGLKSGQLIELRTEDYKVSSLNQAYDKFRKSISEEFKVVAGSIYGGVNADRRTN